MKIQLMRLERWAEEKYGDDKPSVHTLRRWAREALIYPAPVKQGRSYFVQPDAEYMDFSAPSPSSLIRRIHEPKEARRA